MQLTDPIVIADDTTCIRVLTEHGLLDKVRPIPPYDHAATVFETQDHWCLATCDVGHAEARDNGYLIVGLPKALVSKQQALAFFSEAEVASARIPIFELHEFETAPLTAN